MYKHIFAVSILLWVRSTQCFTLSTIPVSSSRVSRILLNAVPSPYNPAAGGLTSATSNLKPGRNYAPTKAGVKHVGSREEGYLGNLQRAGRGEGYSTSSYTSGEFKPMSSAATQSTSVYQPSVSTPQPIMPTTPPTIVTALLTADGVGGRTSSLLFNSRSDAFNYLEAPGGKLPGKTSSVEMRNANYPPPPPPTIVTSERAYIKSGGMTNIPTKARVYLKGDGQEVEEAAQLTMNKASMNRSGGIPNVPAKARVYLKGDGLEVEEGAKLTMNLASIDRVPVVATTAPMHVRSTMTNGYNSAPSQVRAKPSSYAPTQSNIKFKSSTTGSSYLEGLQQQSQGSYKPPIVSRMSDPFAKPKMAASAVSGLLHVDPRSGESFSRDPFAISRKAADAVSLLLLKYTDPNDKIFYLT
jgi:hypothetical protein